MNPGEEHLERLLDAYFEGSLDAASIQDLDQLLTSSTHARDRFWDRASIEGALENWAGKSHGKSLALQPGVSRLQAVWRRRFPAISGWAAAAALMLAWFMESRPREPGKQSSQEKSVSVSGNSSSSAAPVSGDTPVAYLSRVSDGVSPK